MMTIRTTVTVRTTVVRMSQQAEIREKLPSLQRRVVMKKMRRRRRRRISQVLRQKITKMMTMMIVMTVMTLMMKRSQVNCLVQRSHRLILVSNGMMGSRLAPRAAGAPRTRTAPTTTTTRRRAAGGASTATRRARRRPSGGGRSGPCARGRPRWLMGRAAQQRPTPTTSACWWPNPTTPSGGCNTWRSSWRRRTRTARGPWPSARSRPSPSARRRSG
mmetsp:Transcript_40548/g.69910  ORF Transcript_40548/g.69910 Transcript_40548/m.69910 type:complete len:217 (+) Transcript_40548:1369-2019(+)